MYRQAMWLLAAILGAAGCRGEAPNPLEVTVQFERTARVMDGRAQIALRLESEDPARVLLNVQCAEETRTLSLPLSSPSPVVCGMSATFTELTRDADAAVVGAKLSLSRPEAPE
jgi:hypothetical protein